MALRLAARTAAALRPAAVPAAARRLAAAATTGGDVDPVVTSGASQPCWFRAGEAPGPEYRPLQKDVLADVCVVGGGITGVSVAYQLAKEGAAVVLLEDGVIASGETGRTTAHLMSNMDDRFTHLEYLHGARGAQLAAESHQRAIDYIEHVVAAEGIDCDFKRLDGYLMERESRRDDPTDLLRELEAAQRAVLRGVHRVDRAPLPGMDSGVAYCAPNQGRFHPTRYVAGLARALERRGGQIYTRTRAVHFGGGAAEAIVTTAMGPTVRAANVVIATNTPVLNKLFIHAKLDNHRSYVVAADIPRDGYTDALFWDMEDPYHYVRFQPGGSKPGVDTILVGGEDHPVGRPHAPPDELYRRLEAWARARWPAMGRVTSQWSGQVWGERACKTGCGKERLMWGTLRRSCRRRCRRGCLRLSSRRTRWRTSASTPASTRTCTSPRATRARASRTAPSPRC